MSDSEEYTCGVCNREFGSVEARNGHMTSHSTKFKDNVRVSQDGLIENLIEVAEEIGRSPTINDINTHDTSSYSVGPYKREFGSWNNSLEAAGLDGRDPGGPVGELNWNWKGGKVECVCDWCDDIHDRWPKDVGGSQFCSEECRAKGVGAYLASERNPLRIDRSDKDPVPYGPGWEDRRREVYERDDHRCRVCGISRREIGKNPSVHHIRKRSEYWNEGDGVYENVEWEECDSMKNLISLCLECHGAVEGKWQWADHSEFETLAREYVGVDRNP